jgi:secondary thiamine-phosphate synthase enzyme
MRQSLAQLEFHTAGRGLTEITREVASWIATTGITTGLLTLNCLHTSASLLITENASGAVQRDLLRWLDALAPEGADYAHDDEGPDDMPAHLKAVLTNAGLSVPVSGGRPMLGTWQGIFLAEHRRQPHRRAIALHLLGE